MRRRRRLPAGPPPGSVPGGPVYKFGSIAELVARAVNDPSSLGYRASRREDSGWTGAAWADAVDMGLHGDLDGAKRLSPAIIEGLTAMVRSRPRLDPEYRVDGGQWIDVARYVKGEPEAWGSMVESEPCQPTRRVALVVNLAMPGGLSPSAVDKVGAQIGSAVLGLQAAGYTVTLYVAKHIGIAGGSSLKLIAPVNPGGQPLDVARMSAVLRPWFLRRLIFSFYETLPADVRDAIVNNGYGYSQALRADQAQELTGEPHTVVIDLGFEVRNPAGVRAKIINQITNGGM